MRLVVAALVVSLVGCGGSASVDQTDGKAVLEDAIDGRLEQHWSCASLRAASRRLPTDAQDGRAAILIKAAVAEGCA